MTPSERVNLICEIARRLQTESWSVIDLTLRQFGLPTQDTWNNGDTNDYVMRMTESATDLTLIELASHVGYELGAQNSSLEPDFWIPGLFRVFISHLSRDRVKATKLQGELLKVNISSFVAHKDITPTKEWEDEIILALSTCDALVALLEPDFHRSNWTDQEIGFAMGRGSLVIAVHSGEVPYGFMGRFQAVHGIGRDESDLATDIMENLLTHKQTTKRFTQSLVSRLEASGSFAETKRTMRLLERVTYMDRSLLHRIATSPDGNTQVSGTWEIESKIKALVDKWS